MKKAVALRYPENADAPYITASAKGKAAEKLISIARENGVPVVQDENLVNVLSFSSVGDYIPEDTYTVLAQIFAFIRKVETENINEKFQENQFKGH